MGLSSHAKKFVFAGSTYIFIAAVAGQHKGHCASGGCGAEAAFAAVNSGAADPEKFVTSAVQGALLAFRASGLHLQPGASAFRTLRCGQRRCTG